MDRDGELPLEIGDLPLEGSVLPRILFLQ